jgi:hypothetical protein
MIEPTPVFMQLLEQHELCGDLDPMVEKQNQPFQLSFNYSLKVDFQGSRVTSDSGLPLVHEWDERVGLSLLMAEFLTDDRRGKNTQLPLADLLQWSTQARKIERRNPAKLACCGLAGR